MYKYLGAILQRTDTRDADVVGNVLVHSTHHLPHRKDINFDILPLLRLGIQADDFSVEFSHIVKICQFSTRPTPAGVSEVLAAFLNTARNTKLQQYLEEAVSEIRFADSKWFARDGCLDFYIRGRSWRPWIQDLGLVNNNQHSEMSMRKWEEDLDLDLPMGHYHILFLRAPD